jgi:rhamnopyranosyl-N-acetylglucosaminyl-diphospho-decaprenol beta-1,3/1,4-galactofuranosyltransferase
VLLRTSPATTEIVLWDNGSTDDTPDYLRSLDDPRVKAVCHPENIGMNAYPRAVDLTHGEYIVELDDDITDAPAEWDSTLLDAFQRLPNIGYLSADLVFDENDEASRVRHVIRPHLYTEYELNGIRLLDGPTGGGCAMTSRVIYDEVGGFRTSEGEIFWLEDAKYVADVQRLGYRAAILADLRVHHTGGPYYSKPIAAKDQYWKAYFRTARRKNRVKRGLLLIPFVGALNRRYGWFQPPSNEPG